MGAKTGSEAFTKEKDGVSQMQAIDFLKGQGYKNVTDIWIFEWEDENRKYTNIPYAPHLEYVQCLDDGLQAQLPDIDKSEIEVDKDTIKSMRQAGYKIKECQNEKVNNYDANC